ncbi:MAG TPA: hypothetical protein VGN71_04195, partial [Solirubrobacteraceae bacterium]|nr:hypothetical protein [Solirubrobacteraceae bacterium]
VSVKVVEVDRERGRIGLRLADDPEVEGKSVEELAAVAAAERDRPRGGPRRDGRGGGGRGGRDGRGDRPRPRDRDRR